MNVVAILLLASLPVAQVPIPHGATNQVQPHFTQRAQTTPKPRGKWYFARNGHAVFCYGPVMTLPNREGEIEHVATFCRGDQLLVPLKD